MGEPPGVKGFNGLRDILQWGGGGLRGRLGNIETIKFTGSYKRN